MAKSEKPAAARRTNGSGKRVDAHGMSQPVGSRRKRKNQPVVKDTAKMTEKRWTDYLAAIANGTPHREASHAVGLTMQTVEAYLISNVAAANQLRESKLLWNRREWSLEDIENLLAQVAMGRTMKQAFREVGIPRERIASLYQLLLRDKALPGALPSPAASPNDAASPGASAVAAVSAPIRRASSMALSLSCTGPSPRAMARREGRATFPMDTMA